MRLLLIHSDFIEYEAKKKTRMAEEGAVLKDSQKETLIVFCAVESVDEDDVDGVVAQAAKRSGRPPTSSLCEMSCSTRMHTFKRPCTPGCGCCCASGPRA